MQEFISLLHSDDLRLAHRKSPKVFCRASPLNFLTLVSWFLASPCACVQTELDNFFATLRERSQLLRTVSAQALSQARKGLLPSVFTALNAHLVRLVESQFAQPLWHGLRVVAADASDVRLAAHDATRRLLTQAKVFCLYLPMLEMSLHAELYSPCTGERQMLFENLDRLSPSDLLVLDRGYPASWLASAMQLRGLFFCMRVDQVGGKVVHDFVRSGADQALVQLSAPEPDDVRDYGVPANGITVRLIRLLTPEGEVRLVMTNLLDEEAFKHEEFAALYHKRWRVEEAFKRVKHRLHLEHVTGLSWQCHQQDLGAKILSDNLQALLCMEALTTRKDVLALHTAARDSSSVPLGVPASPGSAWIDANEPSVLNTREGKQKKVNRTRAFAAIRRSLPRWLQTGALAADELAKLLKHIATNLIDYISMRSQPRNMPTTKPHNHFAYKSAA